MASSVTYLPLAGLADIMRGVTFEKIDASNYPSKARIPVLRAGNIAEELELKNNLVWIPSSMVSPSQYLRRGDIVMCTSSGSSTVVGKSAPLHQTWYGTVGAFCVIIRPRASICDPEFLAFFLRTPAFRDWTRLAIGANIKNIRKSELENFQVPIPCISEQQRIVTILKRASRISRLRAQTRDYLRQFTQTLFSKMFGDPVANPKGWEVRRLEELAEEFRYGTSQKCYDNPRDKDIPILRIPNVINDTIDWRALKFASLTNKEFEKLRLRSGDLLFVRTNGNPNYIGRCAVFNSDLRAAHASYLIRTRLTTNGVVTPQYVADCLTLPAIRQVMLKLARTTAGNYNINIQNLKNISIPIPPLDLQQIYSTIAVKARGTLNTNDAAFEMCSTLTASLASQLLDPLVSQRWSLGV